MSKKEEKKFKNKYLWWASIISILIIPLIWIYLFLMPGQYIDFNVGMLVVICTFASVVLAFIAVTSYESNNPSIVILGTLFYMVMDFLIMINSTSEYQIFFLILYIVLLAIVLVFGILAIGLEVKLEESQKDTK